MTTTEFTFLMTMIAAAVMAAVLNFWLARSKYESSFSPGILFALLLLPVIRLILPIEFSFTKVIPSHTVFPAVYDALTKKSLIYDFTAFQLILCVWLGGALVSFLKKVVSYLQITKCFRHLPNCADSQTKRYIADSLPLAKHKNIKLVCSGATYESAIYGLRRPVIVVPQDILQNNAALHDVLSHEIAHYLHGDLFFKWVLEFISSLYWFLPPVRALKEHLYTLMEMRADSYAIRFKNNAEKAEYLNMLFTAHLKKITHPTPKHFAIASLSDDGTHSIHRRFNAVLQSEKNKTASRKNALILSAILVLAIAVSYSFVLQPEATRDNAEGTFSLSDGNFHLKALEDGRYNLYLDGEFFGLVNTLDDELSKLPIIN